MKQVDFFGSSVVRVLRNPQSRTTNPDAGQKKGPKCLKDHMNMRILRSMVSRIYLLFGLVTL